MKKLAKWLLGITMVVVGLGLLPYLVRYVQHVRSETTSTKPIISPNGKYEAYVVYKTAHWTEAQLCIRHKGGQIQQSFPVTGTFSVEDVKWSPDSSNVAVMFRASSRYGERFYGMQAMDTSGRSCENFGDFDIPVDDKKEVAGFDSWEWTQPGSIRVDLYMASESHSREVNVLFRIIRAPHDFRMVRSGLRSSERN